jgi:hypothetical protein
MGRIPHRQEPPTFVETTLFGGGKATVPKCAAFVLFTASHPGLIATLVERPAAAILGSA